MDACSICAVSSQRAASGRRSRSGTRSSFGRRSQKRRRSVSRSPTVSRRWASATKLERSPPPANPRVARQQPQRLGHPSSGAGHRSRCCKSHNSSLRPDSPARSSSTETGLRPLRRIRRYRNQAAGTGPRSVTQYPDSHLQRARRTEFHHSTDRGNRNRPYSLDPHSRGRCGRESDRASLLKAVRRYRCTQSNPRPTRRLE